MVDNQPCLCKPSCTQPISARQRRHHHKLLREVANKRSSSPEYDQHVNISEVDSARSGIQDFLNNAHTQDAFEDGYNNAIDIDEYEHNRTCSEHASVGDQDMEDAQSNNSALSSEYASVSDVLPDPGDDEAGTDVEEMEVDKEELDDILPDDLLHVLEEQFGDE
ncbi:hypothetical protein K439DRAFT_1621815 [Ramaria rubella]|nr:hypothetical protein K439DRAFT_1621815 [Ramaria rubella]